MIKINDKSKCSGCGACMVACKMNCINMKYDEEGFLYPEINESLCIDCGLCEKMCQFLNPLGFDNEPKAYACYNKDESIRKASSSGGVFTLIAEEIIRQGGVVFGAAFDENFNVGHICVKNIEDLSMLRGSKYVQSTIGNTYCEAEKYLKADIPVLFTGTPCQIDGLLHYLNKDYEKLYTQDIICHGTPSVKVWQKYLMFRQNKEDSKVKSIFFRSKKYGWRTYSILFEFENGSKYENVFSQDSFMKGFLANIYLRPSCYRCHSKSLNRNSDITLADYWGVEKVEPDMFDNKGTSLVLINTKKGESLFESISDKIIFKQSDILKAVAFNSSAHKSVKMPCGRSKFFKIIDNIDFDNAINICTKENILKRVLHKLEKIKKRLIWFG